jgi:hypothetical protein
MMLLPLMTEAEQVPALVNSLPIARGVLLLPVSWYCVKMSAVACAGLLSPPLGEAGSPAPLAKVQPMSFYALCNALLAAPLMQVRVCSWPG